MTDVQAQQQAAAASPVKKAAPRPRRREEPSIEADASADLRHGERRDQESERARRFVPAGDQEVRRRQLQSTSVRCTERVFCNIRT